MTTKLGLVISDGVGFRNFILSDFLTAAQEAFSEVVIYSCLPAAVYEPYHLTCTIIEIEPFPENILTWFFRKTKEVAHLQKFARHNFGINDNLSANYNKAFTVKGFLTRFIFGITRFLHSEHWINRWNNLQQFTYGMYPMVKTYRKIFQNHPVDVLFFTHQRPPFIAPLIYSARELNIPTAAFIFSWDNLASKGRMAGVFDHYLVWSDLMKEELLQFYESVSPNQISVAGTPQFEPYVLPRYASSRESFVANLNLDPNRKTICFSCGDISTSKNDELYIETIANFILEGKLSEPVNFVVRTSPAESPERFFSLQTRYLFIVWQFPKWELSRNTHQELWSQRFPLAADVVDLRALLQFSDVSINMCSTMSLDFMVFDKPVINPVFGNAENELYDDQRFLHYAHYKRVAESGSVCIAKDATELLVGINEALLHPHKQTEARKKLLHVQISKDLPETGKRLVAALHNLTA
jgi:hypothetical protein